MGRALEYADSHFNEFVEKLKTLSRIPSISFDGFPPEELDRSAQAVAKLLEEEGLENVEILRVEGAHPYIYADWLHAPGKPTLLLYAHHDVQPPGREEFWKTKPFEPVEKDGRLWGRGTADDKAGIVVHSSAIAAYLKTEGKLPVNVKLLIEGEEEIGSGHLEAFLNKYRQKVSADAIVLTDTANYDVGIPTITTSLRGIVVVDVEVKVMDHPLHSGQWGGPGPDPVLALAKMLAALVDEKGRCLIPGFYDDVKPMTDVEKKSLESLGYTDADYRRQAMINPGAQLLGGPASPLEKMTRIPSIAVNAIQASSRKNAANIVNDSAWARVGIRTAPDMDGKKIQTALIEYLKSHAPWGVDVTFSPEGVGNWWMTSPEDPAFKKAARALTEAFGRECVFLGTGGSIPFVEPFAQVLGGVPALLIGVEDPYTNAHSENESLHLGDFKKSIAGAVRFYELMAE